ncbi:hypothetical protein [Streptomyces cucumeris]|uniref:hypothetical protein n=1 Tax=Streptomyces cucumeris TaxID=2962890 RepID=UPI0020C92E26|nr:hypothetical protein [Streptomyces sp. NEAU-Y11]MCP9209587.1 hypothetical protein [Streptomyces sp. NEAU-Y11]
MARNDDSRPLDGDDVIALTIDDVITRYKNENIGIVHGERFTFVHGYSSTSGGWVLADCYGDEIPGGYGPRTATVSAIIR